MSVHTTVAKPGLYFITFTCHQWLPLIQRVNGYDIIYNWFNILAEKGNSITGYVIMPNHVHLLIYYTGTGQSLNLVVGNGKRFMAYEIVKRLERLDEKELLEKLRLSVQPVDKIRGKKHEVWRDSFDVKECRTEKFILQKLHYIHNNPCSGKWKLTADPIHYPHSSASFYISGKTRSYCVRDYLDVMNFDIVEE